ncbi:ABC transporter permease [Nocardioides sp. AE5]|uniref:ABC transporter permease n=1 Tax=Nocardioides sp. AE5 TaxID=2962573 RepID=UPI002881FA5E|nr:ABC transporter permease [Nocardioides sp. AE5]MDT0203222.1 ABC transporter permease [Nocardioides sp. AE5]
MSLESGTPTAPGTPGTPGLTETAGRVAPRRFVHRFLGRKVNVLAAGFLFVVTLLALLAPWLAPHDPLTQDIPAAHLPPFSPDHLLGTDILGRDVLSRMLYGARVAGQAALVSVLIGMGLGVIPGAMAGYLGGWYDAVLSRIADTVLSFPPLLLAMAIVGVMGTNLTNAMLAIGLVFAPRFFRVVRSSVISVREETYIEASRSIGTSTAKIIRRHVFPNALSPLIVQISLACGFAILAEASLSYLGLGVNPPDPSWGRMLQEGRESLFYTKWPLVIPGIAIALSVLACNLLGDGVRDSMGDERGHK